MEQLDHSIFGHQFIWKLNGSCVWICGFWIPNAYKMSEENSSETICLNNLCDLKVFNWKQVYDVVRGMEEWMELQILVNSNQ
jgi:hypothetical protein